MIVALFTLLALAATSHASEMCEPTWAMTNREGALVSWEQLYPARNGWSRISNLVDALSKVCEQGEGLQLKKNSKIGVVSLQMDNGFGSALVYKIKLIGAEGQDVYLTYRDQYYSKKHVNTHHSANGLITFDPPVRMSSFRIKLLSQVSNFKMNFYGCTRKWQPYYKK